MLAVVGSWFVHRPAALAAVAALHLSIWLFARRRSALDEGLSRSWLWAGIGWLAFAGWELLVMSTTPEANIRVDLLLVWPVVLLLTGWALWKSARRTRDGVD